MNWHSSRTEEEKYFTNESVAQQYDKYVTTNIPFYSTALNFITKATRSYSQNSESNSCLEIGAGTGNLASAACIIAKNIQSCFLLDHSEPMLQIAREKWQKMGIGCKLHTVPVSFLDEGWEDRVDSCNIVLSSLTLDHIHEDSVLQQLFDRIYAYLPSGGLFVLAEKCANQNEPKSWNAFLNMIELRAVHLQQNSLKTMEQIQLWKRHILTEDHLRPLSELVRMLELSGFKIAEPRFSRFLFVVHRGKLGTYGYRFRTKGNVHNIWHRNSVLLQIIYLGECAFALRKLQIFIT